jgi:dGTPase
MVGFKVIGGLMDFFIQAVNSDNRENGKTREGKLYQLLSPTLKGLISNYGKIDDQYQRFQMVVDYVSGLSDPYALSLYQKLSGIKLGHVAR